MKIKINNLGALKQAEIALKPLTVFVGPNNTGKTWTAYTLSAILGPTGWQQYSDAYIRKEIAQNYPPVRQAIRQLLEKGNAKIDMVAFCQEFAEKYFNDVSRLSKTWLNHYLGGKQIRLDEFSLTVRLDQAEKDFVQRIRQLQSESGLSAGRNTEALVGSLKEKDDDYLYFFTRTEGHVLDELPSRVVRQFIAGRTFEVLQTVLYPRTYIFPTERTTFVTLASSVLEQIRDRDNIVRSFDDDRLAMEDPIFQILHLIGSSAFVNLATRMEKAKEKGIQPYLELADLLEQAILQGRIDFSPSQQNQSKQELLFQPAADVFLEMPVSSSMVKELTPLLLCLRYHARPNEWLIIDEPEMNLHPEAQVRLLEFLAMLVNAGLKILITTHSPYVVDHLMNLMKAAKNPNPHEIKEKFFLQRADAFIAQEDVSVYLFKQGTAQSILDNEGFINWDTFADVSEITERIYMEI